MPSDELEPRVSALEAQVHKLSERVRVSERDAAAARILAGAADRDTDEFRGELRTLRTEFRGELRAFRRATTTSFNALREDLTDLRGDVTELRGDVTELRGDVTELRGGLTELRGYVDQQFGQVNDGFIEMRGKLDATAAGQQRIAELLEGLIAGQG